MSHYGCKVLTRDLRSLHRGDVQYSREWVDVPGNGAYVSIAGGLTSAGRIDDGVLVYLECCDHNWVDQTPLGVECYRRVRIVDDCPELVAPDLRGEIAYYAPGLSAEQRISLAENATRGWRGKIACCAPWLSAEQRMLLADRSTPQWRGKIALKAPGLSVEQRMSLAHQTTPGWKSEIAYRAPGLSQKQRDQLGRRASQRVFWFCHNAREAR